LKLLADADAFRSCRALTHEPRERFDRPAAHWAARRLPRGKSMPLFDAAGIEELAQEPDPLLPALGIGEQVVADYQSLRLSLNAHPMQLLRPLFSREKFSRASELARTGGGAWRKAAGLVLVRQRPGNGTMVFVTLEDETGVINVAVYASLFERFRRETMAARLMAVEGRLQKSWAGVVHLLARRIYDRSDELSRLADGLHARADRAHHPRTARVIPGSRDFHRSAALRARRSGDQPPRGGSPAASSASLSASVKTRERVRKLTPSGASSEKPFEPPCTTSMINCVWRQYANWSSRM
jgi:error-prone DNA polymerase